VRNPQDPPTSFKAVCDKREELGLSHVTWNWANTKFDYDEDGKRLLALR